MSLWVGLSGAGAHLQHKFKDSLTESILSSLLRPTYTISSVNIQFEMFLTIIISYIFHNIKEHEIMDIVTIQKVYVKVTGLPLKFKVKFIKHWRLSDFNLTLVVPVKELYKEWVMFLIVYIYPTDLRSFFSWNNFLYVSLNKRVSYPSSCNCHLILNIQTVIGPVSSGTMDLHNSCRNAIENNCLNTLLKCLHPVCSICCH